MLTKRIIACLDVTAGRVVKGVQFQQLRDAGDPAELAAAHSQAGADEVVLLDISATHEKRTTLAETVRRTAAQLFIPFTVGGGIRSLNDAIAVFEAGADKMPSALTEKTDLKPMSAEAEDPPDAMLWNGLERPRHGGPAKSCSLPWIAMGPALDSIVT
jgi:imidazoleglycerol phosphate synthase cyclase subunit